MLYASPQILTFPHCSPADEQTFHDGSFKYPNQNDLIHQNSNLLVRHTDSYTPDSRHTRCAICMAELRECQTAFCMIIDFDFIIEHKSKQLIPSDRRVFFFLLARWVASVSPTLRHQTAVNAHSRCVCACVCVCVCWRKGWRKTV